jgi:hypothetical protein
MHHRAACPAPFCHFDWSVVAGRSLFAALFDALLFIATASAAPVNATDLGSDALPRCAPRPFLSLGLERSGMEKSFCGPV